jgi:hypothetical protein
MLTSKDIITKTLASWTCGDRKLLDEEKCGDRANQILQALDEAGYSVYSEAMVTDMCADAREAGYYDGVESTREDD